MKIRGSIARAFWARAAAEEVALQLKHEGWDVEFEARFGNYVADLVARNDGMVRVYEFKTADWGADDAEQAQALRRHAVHELGGDFRLVWVAPPRETEIIVDHIEDALFNALVDDMPSDLDELSTHTRIDGVSDVELRSIHVTHDAVEVSGSGLVEVELGFGSALDEARGDGLMSDDSFPIEFELLLSRDLHVTEVLSISIDTSGYYD